MRVHVTVRKEKPSWRRITTSASRKTVILATKSCDSHGTLGTEYLIDYLLVDLISFIWSWTLWGHRVYTTISPNSLSMPVFCSHSSLLSSMASRRWSSYGSSSQTWLIQMRIVCWLIHMHIVCAAIAAIILFSSNAFLQYVYVVRFWFSFSNCVCDKGLWFSALFWMGWHFSSLKMLWNLRNSTKPMHTDTSCISRFPQFKHTQPFRVRGTNQDARSLHAIYDHQGGRLEREV